MTDVGRHPNITLIVGSEVKSVSGYVGNFFVKVRKKARYVDEKDCTACGECAKVCPVETKDEYNEGFSTRKAIYQQFPQAVPAAYLIDMDKCLGNNPIACGKCMDACEKKCIDLDKYDEIYEFPVGTIIVATGMEVYDPEELDEYGYKKYPDVITSMEFERLINAGGPTEGHLVRPSDRKQPENIAFIQCVGSRSEKRGNPYCSNICCMNTVKDTLLIKDHWPGIDMTVFYMDIRAFGKGFEDLYKRSKKEGVIYIRGIPGRIEQNGETGKLRLAVEDPASGTIKYYDYDMVVLSIGVKPRRDSDIVRQLLTLSKTSDGFLMEAHPKLQPVDAPTKGVFFAGCSEYPKDIKDTVTQSSAAAARANVLMRKGRIRIEAVTASVIEEKCKLCGLCAKVCPYHAIEFNPEDRRPARVVEAACSGCGTCGAECRFEAIEMKHFRDAQIEAQIDAMLEHTPWEKIVVFACNWCSYAGGDYAGVSRLQYPASMRLIRTMCSGRVAEKFVLRAFQKGAALVLVSGCHFADCHYINANRWTQKRVERLWNHLEKKGVRPERLQLEWISAAEGKKFAKVMREIDIMKKSVTKEEALATGKALSPEKPRKAARQK